MSDSTNNITELRGELFDTIKLLKAGKLQVDQARAVAELAGRVIDSARAETEFVKAFGGRGVMPASGFIGQARKPDTLDGQARITGPAPSSPTPGAGLPPSGPMGRV